jgi:hypothetical protein
MVRHRRPKPSAVPSLDPAVLHAAAALSSLAIACILGLWLASAAPSTWIRRARPGGLSGADDLGNGEAAAAALRLVLRLRGGPQAPRHRVAARNAVARRTRDRVRTVAGRRAGARGRARLRCRTVCERRRMVAVCGDPARLDPGGNHSAPRLCEGASITWLRSCHFVQ